MSLIRTSKNKRFEKYRLLLKEKSIFKKLVSGYRLYFSSIRYKYYLKNSLGNIIVVDTKVVELSEKLVKVETEFSTIIELQIKGEVYASSK